MITWGRQHAVWLLFTGLVLLLAANAWLFVPRYLLQQQKLTSPNLQSTAQAMAAIANDGADWAAAIAAGKPDPNNAKLMSIQQRADDIVVHLQHAPYEVSIDDKVQQYLQLAQVISFTLHDAKFSIADNLKMSRTSQILRQAAQTASTLPKT